MAWSEWHDAEVVRIRADGATNAEIAKALGVSLSSVQASITRQGLARHKAADSQKSGALPPDRQPRILPGEAQAMAGVRYGDA